MKEVNYVVSEGMLNHETIYAGTFERTSKQNKSRGLEEWKTRGDVTDMAIGAVLRRWAKIAQDKDINGKGWVWTFKDVEGYTITVEAMKEEPAAEHHSEEASKDDQGK